MGDKQIGQAEFFLQVLQQVEDLGLDGNIQRRDRLVADDKLRVQGQGAGNADALALTAAEGVRIAAADARRSSPHDMQHFADAVVQVGACCICRCTINGSPMISPHRHTRVE